jgi:hypothetical protein
MWNAAGRFSALAGFDGSGRVPNSSIVFDFGVAVEEDDEDDDLRVRAVSDEKSEVSRPDRLVDQTRGAG